MKTVAKTEFKRTQLGVIPEDWEVVRIEDVLSRIIDYRGKTPRKSSSGIRTLSAKSIKHGRIDYNQTYFISEKTFREWERRGKPQLGDVLLTTEGPLGEIAQLDRQDVAIAQRLLTIRGKDKELDNSFLKYFLMSPIGQHELLSKATGTTVQGIKQSEFRKVLIAKPLIEEQIAIAKILSDLDARIEVNHKMNIALETLAKTIFKHWFIAFEFPNEEGKPYKSSGGEMVYNEEMGREIPRGWQPDRLGNHSTIKGRIGWKGLQVSEYVDEGPYIVGGKQLVDNRVFWNDCPRVPQERYDESPEIMLRESDILMTKDGTIGKLAFVDGLREPATVASGIFVIRSNSSTINQMYLWNYFKSDTFRWLVETRIEGSVVPHLYQRDITELQIVLPAQRVASQFESVALSIQRKIAANSEFSLKLDRIRDLLLPRLMSGKIRVPVEVR